ncbi:type IV secretory system conjugative DNA transfer family protein [Amycolatopsis sp. cg5]|uniref:type IV secretory system conjugative DNA transfer family protein n=1 Tax=Amycolatopsis sp. cg5 TaxID=3238802 RepID=UPI00352375DB
MGLAHDGPADLLGLAVPDARHHVHVLGVTGAGKSTQLCRLCVAESDAGRGVALFDCQGDLARAALDRLPRSCGNRLVIVDPAEADAPPVWNPLQADTPEKAELVAEHVVGVFRRLYAAYWGPRMDDTLRAACLTLVRREGSTLADVVPLLTDTRFQRRVLREHGEPEGLAGFWDSYNELSPAGRQQACGPIVSRLRGVFTRRLARDVLAAPRSTFTLSDILDGGVLIARLPKGELGEDCSRLLGSLLLAGLWQAATRRADRKPNERPDATIIVDECHNFLHLPIGVEDALAEARGYRVSLVLAHQHLAQLPADVREAIDANARNKLYFTVSPTDATRLVRHVAPYFDERDLARRAAFQITCRTVHRGGDVAPFTVDAVPASAAIRGRAQELTAAARARTGLPREVRDRARKRRELTMVVGSEALLDKEDQSLSRSQRRSARQSPAHPQRANDWRTLAQLNPQEDPTEEAS